jgi:hypothetical protein
MAARIVDVWLSSRITNALDDTTHILWYNFDLDSPDLRRELGENTDSICETGSTTEEASCGLTSVNAKTFCV